MAKSGHILVINPGASSTKLALYSFDISNSSLSQIHHTSLDFSNAEPGNSRSIIDQLDYRSNAVEKFLSSTGIKPDLIMARGGPLRPLAGGVYAVDQEMLNDLKTARYGDHASRLAALIGDKVGKKLGVGCWIADPVTTDEFEALARISGVPEIERKSRSHALNIKASARKLCKRIGKDILHSSWVVCHLGSGISVAALKNGQIIDVNDALLGMGPFSHDRAGALPIAGLLKMAYSGKYTQNELEILLSHESGLKAYLGTANFKEVEERLDSADPKAQLIVGAMVYQIAKEISAMASVFAFKIDGILLTGGMAHSQKLCEAISARVQALTQIFVEAGEDELEALAQAGFRVMLGGEAIKIYGETSPGE
ncbi:MAG: butyrate kinase [Candidatus Marinimicrobia bacterium]|nr:butyrate kinase [Candidatus Neomarinimicrobiota bacterium]